MTRPRKDLVSLDDTPYYHCATRCVRRAFLCGMDHSSGNCFEHRRSWVKNRIKQLAAVFLIDIAAYAVMTNHYHIVLRVNREQADCLTRDEVIKRWRLLFKGPPLIQSYCAGNDLSKPELDIVDDIVAQWRERLIDISWFMRCLNEYIARKANAEDGCKGRFWEGRFTTQALLDETAVLACMAYVDLNPVRAGIADRPETSHYTSLQERLGMAPNSDSANDEHELQAPLMPFADSINGSTPANTLSHSFTAYLELVDWTGRAVREDKQGNIPANLPPILQRLNISPEQWLKAACSIERSFCGAIGPVERLEQYCERLKKHWLHGMSSCRALYAVA